MASEKGFNPVTVEMANMGTVQGANPLMKGRFVPGAPPVGRASAANGGACLITCSMTLIFAIAVAALAMAANVFRPPVWLDQSPASPSGYFYGGAVYQGSGTWINKAASALPSARSDMTAVAVGSKVYILGGWDGQSTVTNEIWEFDTVFERFNTSKSVMPITNFRFGAAAIGSVIYMAGGMQVPDASGGVPHKMVFAYDIRTDTWSRKADLSLERVDTAAAAYNGRVYVFGGYGPNYDLVTAGVRVEAYDPGTDTWTRKTDMPTRRGDLSAVLLGSRVFVLGGWNDNQGGGGGVGQFQSATEVYSPGSDSWEKAANMLLAKGDVAAAAYRGMVFAIGGEVWSGTVDDGYDVNQVPTHDTMALTPDTAAQGVLAAGVDGYDSANAAQGVAKLSGGRGVWTPMAPVPAGRYRFCAATTDSSQALWVFGGTKDQGEVVNSVLAYYDTWHPKVYIHYKA